MLRLDVERWDLWLKSYDNTVKKECVSYNMLSFYVCNTTSNKQEKPLNELPVFACVWEEWAERWGHTSALSPNQYSSVHVCELMRPWCRKVSYDDSSGYVDLLQDSSISSNENNSGNHCSWSDLWPVPRISYDKKKKWKIPQIYYIDLCRRVFEITQSRWQHVCRAVLSIQFLSVLSHVQYSMFSPFLLSSFTVFDFCYKTSLKCWCLLILYRFSAIWHCGFLWLVCHSALMIGKT